MTPRDFAVPLSANSEAPAVGRDDAPPVRPVALGPDFQRVYSELYRPIGSYLLRRTGCQHATEDLLSDVFLAVLRGLPSFSERGTPVRHWVFRIANHAANRWLLRQRSDARALARRAEDLRASSNPEQPSVVSELARRDAARHALQCLPRRLQEVAALHYLAGLSLEEVAATLRCPQGTVKSRLSRARARVRELLRDEEAP